MGRENRSITIEIAGRIYHIKSKDEETHVLNLAKMVSDRMVEIERATNTVDSIRVADLTCLNLADDYCKLKNRYEQKIKELELERDKLQKLIDKALRDLPA